jgi:transposase
VLLREYLADGLSQSAIAEKLGVNRRTIYRWIHSGELERELDEVEAHYGPRPSRPRKIDPYRPIIDTRLSQYPQLSAVRLLEEIQAAGYDGGYSQVRDYVRSVRPADESDLLRRFETPPGFQAQVDFAHFRLPWGRRYALVVVLGFSRLLWVRFYRRQTMEVLTYGLEEAFRFFGGVPRELLFDQMKAVVNSDLREAGGALEENVTFLRFAVHYGFRIRACRPYRAKTKGKVERPIRYLRENFFYGREFAGDEDLNARLEHWLRTHANVRTHGTTGERPIERFNVHEQSTLGALPLHQFPRLNNRGVHVHRTETEPCTVVERRPLTEYAALVGSSA